METSNDISLVNTWNLVRQFYTRHDSTVNLVGKFCTTRWTW